MYKIEVEHHMHNLLQGQTSKSAREMLIRALHQLEDKPNRLSIKTIPYKEMYRLCTRFCSIYAHLTDDDMKCQILRVAGSELNFDQSRLLMNLLDMINIDNVRQKHITVKILDVAVVIEEL